MTGKCGRDELLREKNAKYLDRWAEAYEQRHGKPPTDEQKRDVLMEGRVIKDYDRLRGASQTIRSDYVMEDVVPLEEYIRGEKAVAAIDARLEGPKLEAEKQRSIRSRARAELRAKCPIPFNVMRFLQAGSTTKELVAMTFDVTSDEVVSYIDAFFNND
jgi:hypothetical protein